VLKYAANRGCEGAKRFFFSHPMAAILLRGDRLRELSAPTLVAAGTEDIVIPPSNALALVNAISGAWLARFKGGGHAFMAQYPRPLANLINEFLALG
jgi:pimeloyl-ACP methyl ester carboxylesterase